MSGSISEWLNAAPAAIARGAFRKCCGASWWCDAMAAARPFEGADGIGEAAERTFDTMPREAWLEAFASHPKIGDLDSLRMRFAGNKQWSAGEQAGVDTADDETLRRLAEGNAAYERRFGYLFLICATGKSAAEMLRALERRLANDEATEWPIACGEQRKITRLRLAKLTPEETSK